VPLTNLYNRPVDCPVSESSIVDPPQMGKMGVSIVGRDTTIKCRLREECRDRGDPDDVIRSCGDQTRARAHRLRRTRRAGDRVGETTRSGSVQMGWQIGSMGVG
jgi:hypothetical protein